MAQFADSGAFLDPDASRDYLRSWKERVDRQAANAQAMSDRIAQLRASAKDSSGLADVTIDATGVMVDLKLSERIRWFTPEVVARAVMTALHEARVIAATRSREIALEMMGPDSVAARTIADRMQRMLERPESDGVQERGVPGQGWE